MWGQRAKPISVRRPSLNNKRSNNAYALKLIDHWIITGKGKGHHIKEMQML